MPLDDVRVRDILRVLTRIPIHHGQLTLYALSVAAPDKGFTSTDVRNALSMDQAKHRGLMAALTVRINNTPHEADYGGKKPALRLFFTMEWDGDENTYRARPELLEAFKRLPKLSDAIGRPLAEVTKLDPLSVALPEGIVALPPAPKGKTVPPTGTKVGATDVRPFHKLLATLDASGFVFPGELVANVLLALQVKRFVILTGISGTGKTKIGQAIASTFQVTRYEQVAPETDDHSAVVQVHPYMRKRGHFVLPAVLGSQVSEKLGSGRINARWPGGTLELATFRRQALRVLFKGALKKWFVDTLQEGEKFIVRLEDENGPAPTIVFELPGAATKVAVENAEVIAVRPDWTDHRGLLGHYNPLSQQYVTTRFLQLMLRADDECARAKKENRPPAPFFVLLDEMNLARVEHYFADFLSALESEAPVHLHDVLQVEEGEGEDDEPIPRRLHVPPNLFFIGTVNVDESTYMFSPKVLDRAFAIEFNTVNLKGLAKGVEAGGELDLVKWTGRLDPPARPSREDWQWLSTQQGGELMDLVDDLHALLARHNRHFGYRVATELARFVRLALEQAHDPEAASWAALDLAVLQKVLVKLSGTQAELQDLVQSLLELTLAGRDADPTLRDLARWKLDPVEDAVTSASELDELEPVFPRSAAKLWHMRDRLIRQGFASWVE